MPSIDSYLAAAWQTAPLFGLDPTAVELLSHSENVVCAVTASNGSRAALRIHRPGYNSIAELRSEVQWVASLGAFGVPVPTAVQTTDGDHYVSAMLDGDPHHVGVVEWVQGAPLGGPTTSEGAEVVEHYGQIGALAAQVRSHHAQWKAPDGFTRRSWDRAGFVGDAPLWGRFWELAALSDSQRDLFSRCRDRLDTELGALSTTPQDYGLIHSDLHLGNLMADGPDLTMIDFDDAGYGWFVHELAVALHPLLEEPWEADARAALLNGYRQVHPFSAQEEAQIDLFLTVRSLMIVGWLDARRELPVYEHFDELVAQAERMADRYLGTPSHSTS